MTGDLTVEENCHFLIAKTIETFKRIDVLVANAGIVSASRLENMKMEDFDKVMNINCRVVVLMNKLVIPYLSETKGNIINVSSVAGIRAVRPSIQTKMSCLIILFQLLVYRHDGLLHEQGCNCPADSLCCFRTGI